MRKTYRCTNVKFCMEDEVQRRAWEYLHNDECKDGSYEKILSEALIEVLEREKLSPLQSEYIANNIPQETARLIIKGMFVKNTPLFFVQKYCIKNKNKYNDIIDRTKRRHER